MIKKILLGTDIFDKLIDNDGYYVDKTEILYDLVDQTTNEVTLFTRPRRFGKSLMMSMMENFFDIRRRGSTVFEGLSILKNHPDFCGKWMHQYPTLLISLKDVEGLSYEKAYAKLKTVIANLCKKYAWLEFEENVLPADAEQFHRLQFETADESNVENSLQTIMRMLYAVYGRPVILLIDEYDVPLAKAHENHYYRQILDVIRGFMSISLKSNEYLQFSVITGCLQIPKESIFTGVNNFASYSVLDDEFSDYFGFTQDETIHLLKYYDQEDKMKLVRPWYDGFVFGNTEIYCPWDAMSYVSALRKRRNAVPKPYWENTSGTGAIRSFFELQNEDITDQFETLLNGGTITQDVTTALTYEEAYTSLSNLWSVLLMTGYVTAVHREDSEDCQDYIRRVDLRIPNREIAQIFQKAVSDHFKTTVDQNRINILMEALWNGEEENASAILSDLLFETISYMDYHEDYYHAFVAGIFAGRGYIPQSNKEQGLGRPDVDLRDRKNRRMMIIECKKSDSQSRLDYWCDEAIQQIIDNQYARKTDGFNTVRCYGAAFFEKSAKVKLMK